MRQGWSKLRPGAEALALILCASCDTAEHTPYPNPHPPIAQISLEDDVDSRVITAQETEASTDPLAQQQWYLENAAHSNSHVHMPQNWDEFSFSQDTILAVIDSGLDFSHPDIDLSKVYVNPGESGIDANGNNKASNGIDDDANGLIDDVRGWSFADNTPTQKDAIGHGTHVMGILAAANQNGLGIASPWRGFRILPIQIFSGARPSADPGKIAGAIRYAVNMGAKVISASFGTPSYNSEIYDAVHYAQENDVLFVSAVGNFRKNLNSEPNYPSGFGLSNQVAVAASDDSDMAATFTNFGNGVDIFAPGNNIVSLIPNGQYAVRSGTSQACPMVAATAAMLRSLKPSLSASEVKQHILTGADESSGLANFSPLQRRLNVLNTLKETSGARLAQHNTSNWQRVQYALESGHPYANNSQKSFQVFAPAGTIRFKIHFSRLETQSTDTLALTNSQGQPIALYSGVMGEFWTPVVEGDSATLTLTTDKSVSEWGFFADSLLTENRSPSSFDSEIPITKI